MSERPDEVLEGEVLTAEIRPVRSYVRPVSGRPRGRPTTLSSLVIDRLCESIMAGNYIKAACAHAGIGYSSLREWLIRAEQGEGGIYLELAERLALAEAASEASVVAQWTKLLPTDWKACRDFLARRFPERWSPKFQGEMLNLHAGADPGATQINVYLPENGRDAAAG